MQNQIGNEFKSVLWELLTSSITSSIFFGPVISYNGTMDQVGLKAEKKLHGTFTFIGSSVIKHDHNMQD